MTWGGRRAREEGRWHWRRRRRRQYGGDVDEGEELRVVVKMEIKYRTIGYLFRDEASRGLRAGE